MGRLLGRHCDLRSRRSHEAERFLIPSFTIGPGSHVPLCQSFGFRDLTSNLFLGVMLKCCSNCFCLLAALASEGCRAEAVMQLPSQAASQRAGTKRSSAAPAAALSGVQGWFQCSAHHVTMCSAHSSALPLATEGGCEPALRPQAEARKSLKLSCWPPLCQIEKQVTLRQPNSWHPATISSRMLPLRRRIMCGAPAMQGRKSEGRTDCGS